MNIKFIIEVIILIYSNFLSISRVNALSFNNDSLCDITLDLSNTGIKYLTSNFINTKCVRKLLLQNNNIENLEIDIFDTQPYLEYLDLSRNYLKLNNLLSYGSRSNLKVLILDNNNYCLNNIAETINAYNYHNSLSENNDKIEITKQKHTQLIIPDVFPELQYLSLRNVHIDTLPDNWIIYFPKLSYLDLSENMFSAVTLKHLLNNIPATIKNLTLENVGLTVMRNEHLITVENINLNHNYFSRIKSHMCYDDVLCFETKNNLKVLSISNCSITFIEENAFEYMNNLLKLDISNNYFTNIMYQTFDYVPSLTSLNLSKNSLQNMPNIKNLKNLTSLILNDMKTNMFKSLKTFDYLPNLKYISMRNNKLRTIPSTLFNNLPALEVVDLSNNQITHLPSWKVLKSVRQIYLNSNKIENLYDISINTATSLELLVLKNNSISKINITSLLSILPNNNVILYL